jgi:hypothetical protein
MKDASFSEPSASPTSGVRRAQDSSFISKWSFSYFSELLKRGQRGIISKDDIQLVEDEDKAQRLAESIMGEWTRQLQVGEPR